MTGHLQELLVALITLIRNCLGLEPRSRQMIPVRVRSRRAQMLQQAEQARGYSSCESNALPAWYGEGRSTAFTALSPPRGESDPSCPSSPPEDL